MKVVYDTEADILYLTCGTPEYTEYIEYSEDVILRRDPDIKRLAGVTIIGFSRHFEKVAPNLSDWNLPIRKGK